MSRYLPRVVGSIADLLDELCPEIEAQLKPNLHGIFGGVIRGYLPQAWALKTETETVTLDVNTEGSVPLRSGGSPNPPVLVKGNFDPQATALSIRNQTNGLAGPIQATPSTSKENRAFQSFP